MRRGPFVPNPRPQRPGQPPEPAPAAAPRAGPSLRAAAPVASATAAAAPLRPGRRKPPLRPARRRAACAPRHAPRGAAARGRLCRSRGRSSCPVWRGARVTTQPEQEQLPAPARSGKEGAEAREQIMKTCAPPAPGQRTARSKKRPAAPGACQDRKGLHDEKITRRPSASASPRAARSSLLLGIMATINQELDTTRRSSSAANSASSWR